MHKTHKKPFCSLRAQIGLARRVEALGAGESVAKLLLDERRRQVPCAARAQSGRAEGRELQIGWARTAEELVVAEAGAEERCV